ncbi:hypothetical protein LTR08_008764 [Meristemomyces frigidus]|nr:hypothetical protein LTR08_008764 [Meristemomyces frigidus]
MTLFTKSRPRAGLRYYEDIYGKRNEDEQFDRHDECESETSSEEEDEPVKYRNTASNGSIKKFSGQTRQSPTPGESGRSTKSIATNLTSNTDPNTAHHYEHGYKISPNINSKHSIRTPASKKLQPKKGGMFSNLSTPTKTNDMNNSDNLSFTTPLKASNTMDTYPTPQSIDQLPNDKGMKPFLQPGGLGGLNDGFREQYESTPQEAMAEDPFLAGILDFANASGENYGTNLFGGISDWGADNLGTSGWGAPPAVMGGSDPLSSASLDNGQIERLLAERQGSGHQGNTDDSRVFGYDARTTKQDDISSPIATKPLSAVVDNTGYYADAGELQLGPSDTQPRLRGRPKLTVTTTGQTRGAIQPSETRYTTRGDQKRAKERQKAERVASRPRTRSTAVTDEAKGKATSTRDKATARSATLHKKAKKKVTREDVMKAADASTGHVSKGRLVRETRGFHSGKTWVNWMGKEMRLEAGQGYVVVGVE